MPMKNAIRARMNFAHRRGQQTWGIEQKAFGHWVVEFVWFSTAGAIVCGSCFLSAVFFCITEKYGLEKIDKESLPTIMSKKVVCSNWILQIYFSIPLLYLSRDSSTQVLGVKDGKLALHYVWLSTSNRVTLMNSLRWTDELPTCDINVPAIKSFNNLITNTTYSIE